MLVLLVSQLPHGAGAATRQPTEHRRLTELPASVPAAATPGAPGPPRIVAIEGSAGAARTSVERVGGTVLNDGDGVVHAEVDGQEVAELEAQEGVTAVRSAPRWVPHVVSEGVSATGASTWHNGGTDGSGIDVAVVDIGFAGWEDAVAAGELPTPAGTLFGQCTSHDLSHHGTAVAEIVHDMAPGAQLHLICTDDTLDLDHPDDPIHQYLRTNDIDVANASFGTNVASRGDGGGAVDRAIDESRRDGTLWTVSSGNGANGHAVVPAGSPVQRLDLGDGFYTESVDLRPGAGVDPYLAFTVGAGDGDNATGEALIELKWDRWPTTNVDFDAYVLTQPSVLTGEVVGAGVDDQLTLGGPPIESFSISNPSPTARTFYLFVDSWHSAPPPAGTSPTPARLDIFIDGVVGNIEHVAAAGSVSEPGTSRGALTVGAACHTEWDPSSADVLEPFSSRGPTIDDRVKPDLVGPDGVSTGTFGTGATCGSSTFLGTSASAPHVAGAAALHLESNPALDPSELQARMEADATPSGSPGRDNQWGWGQLALGAPGPSPAPAGHEFTGSSPPTRLLDTRLTSSPVQSGATRRLSIAGTHGVPADATAVVLNLAAVRPTREGYLTVFPAGAARPIAANLNFSAGDIRSNSVTVGLGTNGAIDIFNYSGITDIVVDLAGWYGPSGTTGLENLAPIRAVDTRPGRAARVPTPTGDFGGTEVLTVPLAGHPAMTEVPATATTVVANVAVTGPTHPGHITVWPTGLPRPTAANLNFRAGQTIANLVVAPVGASGSVNLYASLGKTHVVIDVLGYFDEAAPGRFVALPTVVRIGDTRTGNGALISSSPQRVGPFQTRRFDAAHFNGVPGDAVAVNLNVTAVHPTAATGHLNVWGKGSQPTASTLNFTRGSVVPNAALTSLGTATGLSPGQISILNTSTGSVDYVVDLSGYFVAG